VRSFESSLAKSIRMDIYGGALRGWTSYQEANINNFESFLGGKAAKGSKGDKPTKKHVDPNDEDDRLEDLQQNQGDDLFLVNMLGDQFGELGLDFGQDRFDGGDDELDQILNVRDRDQDLDNGSTKEPDDDKDVYDFIGGELDKEQEEVVSYDDVEEFL
jgi:hypothetical protein